MRYNDALQIGILPSEFWNMSLLEVKDTVHSRFKQRQNDIYALSSMVRVAVLSCFSEEVDFPEPPYYEEEQKKNSWKNSYEYLKALSEIKRGGANK